jgi:hypothetical protein
LTLRAFLSFLWPFSFGSFKENSFVRKFLIFLFSFSSHKYLPNFKDMAALPQGSREHVMLPSQFSMQDYEEVTLTTPDNVKIKG